MATRYEGGATGIVSAVFLALLPLNSILVTQTFWPLPSPAESTAAASAASSGEGLDGDGHALLKGRVSLVETTTVVGHRIDDLLDVAVGRDPQTAVLNKAVEHYRTKAAKVTAKAKDDADFLFCYRGFGPSSEAGDIITGEKLKIKSRSSAEYARQKHIDELHTKIVLGVMQIAMGLGLADRVRSQETVNSGVNSLKSVVGEDEAAETMRIMSDWSKQIRVPDDVFKQPTWDVARRSDMSSVVVKTAMARDPVVTEIQNHLHKYNQLSKWARGSGRVLQTALGVASRTPVVHHLGTPALVAFVTATGGPEQSKIMQELYLDRRIASRLQVISDETHMALENYQIAVLTSNPILLACSESIVQHLAGPDVVYRIFGTSVLPPGSKTPGWVRKPQLAAKPVPAYKGTRRVTVQRQTRVQIGYRGARGD